MKNANLKKAKELNCAKGIKYANFEGANLNEVDFHLIKSKGKYPSQVVGEETCTRDLRGINLSSTSLEGAIFKKMNLSGAKFRNADLNDADFREANLSGADFRGSTMRGVLLDNAKVEGANFRDVDGLSSSQILYLMLHGAILNDSSDN